MPESRPTPTVQWVTWPNHGLTWIAAFAAMTERPLCHIQPCFFQEDPTPHPPKSFELTVKWRHPMMRGWLAGRQGEAFRLQPNNGEGAHAILGLGTLRVVATLVLTFVILVVFLGYLLSNTIFGNVFDAGFYTESLSENRIYERFYDEVLLEEGFEDVRNDLLGSIEVVSHEDIVWLTRQIIPPDYVQEQVEASIESLLGYLDGDEEPLELLIDLGPPLERTKPVLLDYIDERIDEVPEVPVDNLDELQAGIERLYDDLRDGRVPSSIPKIEDPTSFVIASVEGVLDELPAAEVSDPLELAEGFGDIYVSLASGRIPDSIPSLGDISPLQRELFVASYEPAVAFLAAAPTISPDVRRTAVQALEENEEAIKQDIRAGNMAAALVPAVEPLVRDVTDTFIDAAYDDAVRALDEDGRLSDDSLDSLRHQEEGIKALLTEGDIKGSLKLGSRSIAGSLIDESTEEIRSRLVDPEDGSEPRMLDLVQWAADEEGVSREALLEDLRLEDVRRFAGRVDQGEAGLLGIIALASIAVALVYLPRLSSGLLWMSGILLTVGGISLVVGVALRAVLPGQVDIRFTDMLLDATDDIPESALNMIADVLRSMVTDATVDWVIAAVLMVASGVVVLAASLLAKRLGIPILSR